ncbi:MAG TPA: rhodanese-like domain-containing protein [Acidimicrobiia bacterium]|nr:rhodanese-like domain-containing protein [Acidimicrobiia bacterium]
MITASGAILIGVVAAGCGSDNDNSAGMHNTEPAPVHTETKTETSLSEAFARLDPAAFENRMAAEAAALINVHIPYEGELADTDAFIRYDKILGDARLPQEKNTEILLYCRSGRMSEEAGAELNKAGYTNVAHLEGGMKAWEASGRRLIHDPAKATETPAGEHS